MKKYAYVTLLSSDNYLPGVLGLFDSVRRSQTIYPFVVVATRISEKTLEILESFDMTVITAPPIDPPAKVAAYNKEIGLGIWNNCFDKFHIFNLTIFDKIIYLDADMEVISNIDELFSLGHPGFVRDPAKFFQITDFKDYTTNNAGMMIIDPSTKVFEELVSIMKAYEEVDIRGKGIIVSDQLIFDSYYAEAFTKEGFLDFQYNSFFPYLDFYRGLFPNLAPKVIHYAGMEKPWTMSFSSLFLFKDDYAARYKMNLLKLLRKVDLKIEWVNLK